MKIGTAAPQMKQNFFKGLAEHLEKVKSESIANRRGPVAKNLAQMLEAKIIELHHQSDKVDPNQENNGLGQINLNLFAGSRVDNSPREEVYHSYKDKTFY
ncbi:hypothetical protein [Burkholderia contaminans]|uniref:hypothetical protein n=1 Tax=Burkholderia contaminans TaxID=488447 RepID=UPI00126028A3|nr:hypothetical protein [Burkholderia contaminans]